MNASAFNFAFAVAFAAVAVPYLSVLPEIQVIIDKRTVEDMQQREQPEA
jgi:hypothetical protein